MEEKKSNKAYFDFFGKWLIEMVRAQEIMWVWDEDFAKYSDYITWEYNADEENHWFYFL